MKTVFSSNSEVCHVFASQTQSKGNASSVFFNSDALYSYGYHFAIAAFSKDGNTVYFTTRGYSVSTAKHINYAWQALHHFSILQCAYPDKARSGQHEENLKDFDTNARQSSLKLPNARKPEIYLLEISRERERFEAYCMHFGIRVTKKLKDAYPFVFIESKEQGTQAKEKLERFKKSQERARIKANAKRHAEELKEFRAFERQRMYSHNGLDYLRFNSETNEVQTSQGVTIDKDESLRVLHLIKVAIERGGCTNCGTVDGRYKITSIDTEKVVIGCHVLRVTEILAIEKYL